MSIIGEDINTLIDTAGLRSTFLVKELKNKHGTRCLGLLIAMLGDGDWTTYDLFSHFRLTTMVKATHQLRRENVVVEARFLKRLEHDCFWKLNRNQQFKLADEVLFLFPDQFDHLQRWIDEGA